MNLFKQLSRLFKSNKAFNFHKISLPFDLNKVKAHEKYLSALLGVVDQEDELDSFKIDNHFYLIFGDPGAIHIMYFGVCDLYILMEPEQAGWTATAVGIAHTQEQREQLQADGYQFLFNIPNPVQRSASAEDEGMDWTEQSAVMLFS